MKFSPFRSVRLLSCSILAFSAALPVALGAGPAGADLSVSILPPAPELVEVAGGYSVRVASIGKKGASNVRLQLSFPLTHTSPQKFILGNLSQLDPRCSLQLGVATCSLGNLAKGASTSVGFQLAFPVAAEPLQIRAVASSDSVDVSSANNTGLHTASLQYKSFLISAPATASNAHCTGTGLVAFFECAKFPSSISTHSANFEAGGTLSFTDEPLYYGFWDHPNGDSSALHFEVWFGGGKVAEFSGRGSLDRCFDGVTHFFPDEGYVSPYRVCF